MGSEILGDLLQGGHEVPRVMIESCVCGRKWVAYLDGSSGIITSYKDEYAVGQDNVIGLNNPGNPDGVALPVFFDFVWFLYFLRSAREHPSADEFPQRDLPYVAAAASSSQPASLFVPEAPSLNRFGVSGFRRF